MDGLLRQVFLLHGKNQEAVMSTEPSVNHGKASAPTIDMKLEVVVIPVSDVERAKKFYRSIQRHSAWACQLRLLCHVQRPGRQRLAFPGGHGPASRSHRPGNLNTRFVQ